MPQKKDRWCGFEHEFFGKGHNVPSMTEQNFVGAANLHMTLVCKKHYRYYFAPNTVDSLQV